MIIKTVEGYIPKEYLNEIFHIERDGFGETQWVMDAPLYEKPGYRSATKIRITVEQID